MNIVFFANGTFAIPSLDILKKNSKYFSIKAVVTNVDKKIGRGQKTSESLISKYSKKNSLDVIKIKDFNDKYFINNLKKLNADIFVVISYRILPEYIYNIPNLGSINLHTSVLPEYRGAAPIQRSIMDGKNYLGLTSFFLNDNIDEGDIILSKKVPIDENITYGESFEFLSIIAPAFLIETLHNITKKKKVQIQSNKNISYAKKINKKEYCLSLSSNAKSIHNHIRALTPPGCHIFFNNKKIKLFNTFYNDDNMTVGSYKYINEKLHIGCRKGSLIVSELQFEGKKVISAKDFNNMNFKDNTIFKSTK